MSIVAVADAFDTPTPSETAVAISPTSSAIVFALPPMITVPPRIVASSIVMRASNERVR